MIDSIKAGLVQAVALGFPGLITGVIAGWIGLARADGAAAVASVVAKVYLALVLLLPGTLAFWTLASLNDQDRVNYVNQARATVMLLVAGFFGAVIGTAFFLVVAINVPAIFGGEDQVDLRLQLMDQVGWGSFGLVTAVTTLSGFALAIWAHRQVAQIERLGN
jgi:hypothetical protein